MAAYRFDPLFDALEERLRLLADHEDRNRALFRQFQQRIDELEEDLQAERNARATAEARLLQQDNELERLAEQLQIARLAAGQAAQPDPTAPGWAEPPQLAGLAVPELRQKINDMIREIDQCLKLLNE